MTPTPETLLQRAKFEALCAFYRTKDKACHAFPKLMGKKLRYWVLIYEGARLMDSREEVPAVKFVDILKRAG